MLFRICKLERRINSCSLSTLIPPDNNPKNSNNNGHHSKELNNENENNEHKKPRWFSISGQVERLLLKARVTQDPDTARLAAKSTSAALYSLIGMSALGTLGVDTAPLLTGIGVTGFTVGFAMKEIATNFLSGMLLVLNRPFRKGQHLRIMIASMPGLEGEVVSIDARYVLLKSKTGAKIMVPSVIVYTNPFQVSNPIESEKP